MRVRLAYLFTGVRRQKLTCLAECDFPVRNGEASRRVSHVEMTSNGATEVLKKSEIACFNRSEFC